MLNTKKITGIALVIVMIAAMFSFMTMNVSAGGEPVNGAITGAKITGDKTVVVGDDITLTGDAVGTPTGTVTYAWSSGDASIATLTNNTAVACTVTGVKAGTVTITLTATDPGSDGGADAVKTATIEITVLEKATTAATFTGDTFTARRDAPMEDVTITIKATGGAGFTKMSGDITSWFKIDTVDLKDYGIKATVEATEAGEDTLTVTLSSKKILIGDKKTVKEKELKVVIPQDKIVRGDGPITATASTAIKPTIYGASALAVNKTDSTFESFLTKVEATTGINFGEALDVVAIPITDDSADDTKATYTFDTDYTLEVTSSNKAVIDAYISEKGELFMNAMGAGSATVTITVTPVKDDGPKAGKLDIKIKKVIAAKTAAAVGEDGLTLKLTTMTAATLNKDETAYVDGIDAVLEINFSDEKARLYDGADGKGPITETNEYDFSTSVTGFTTGGKYTKLAIGTDWATIAPMLDKNKGGTFMFASAMDTKTGTALPGATIWNLSTINPRPAAVKAKATYGLIGDTRKYTVKWDKTSSTPVELNERSWYLDDGKGTLITTPLLYAYSPNGKTLDWHDKIEHMWCVYHGAEECNHETKWDTAAEAGKAPGYEKFTGELVAPIGAGGKAQKLNYLFKTMPIITATTVSGKDDKVSVTPSSKVSKVSVSGQLKAPSVKVDYKKQLVNVKAGLAYTYGTPSIDETTEKVIVTPSYLTKKGDPYVMDKASQKEGVKFYETKTKGVFSLQDGSLIAENWNEDETLRAVGFMAFVAPTAKKPASDVYTCLVFAPSKITDDTLDEILSGYSDSAGTFTLKAGWQALVNDKWAKSLKVTAGMTVKVRQMSTIKFNAKSPFTATGKAGSEEITLTITWGQMKDSDGKAIEGKEGVTKIKAAAKNVTAKELPEKS